MYSKRFNGFKKFICFIFIITIFTLTLPVNHAGATVYASKEVRVGLYFKTSNKDTTAREFKVRSQGGCYIGFSLNGKYFTLYDYLGTLDITVETDEVYGYHVKIGGGYVSAAEAQAVINKCKTHGINAFAVYGWNWEVWAGSFNSLSEANSKAGSYQSLTGKNCSVVNPSANRIKAVLSNGVTIAAFAQSSGYFQVKPKGTSEFNILKINGKAYRGDLEFRKLSDSKITVINIIDLEEYIKGVVPCEIEPSAPMEAIKAQAIAARTFALSTVGKHVGSGFDICNTDCCQVYGGYDMEYNSTNQAVIETRNKVVTYCGMLAQIFYCASSGGWTENCENVWFASIPYLKGVPDPYESPDARYAKWDYEFSPDDIRKMVEDDGHYIGAIKDITITKVSDSGRALEMVITGQNGQVKYTKSNTRLFFDPSLPSQKFHIDSDADLCVKLENEMVVSTQPVNDGIKIQTAGGILQVSSTSNLRVKNIYNTQTITFTKNPSYFTACGEGKGHGVGMSQEGAKGMARLGYTCNEILTYYFTGTKVESAIIR